LKIYFIRILKKKYSSVWIEIGRPKFWGWLENIEDILLLKDHPALSYKLNCQIKVYSILYKVESYSTVLLFFSLIMYKLLESMY
jgi:hypothetical protein